LLTAQINEPKKKGKVDHISPKDLLCYTAKVRMALAMAGKIPPRPVSNFCSKFIRSIIGVILPTLFWAVLCVMYLL
jgi:hypothetical protein